MLIEKCEQLLQNDLRSETTWIKIFIKKIERTNCLHLWRVVAYLRRAIWKFVHQLSFHWFWACATHSTIWWLNMQTLFIGRITLALPIYDLDGDVWDFQKYCIDKIKKAISFLFVLLVAIIILKSEDFAFACKTCL